MFVSIDGTDFKICKPHPFDSKYYSQKINHAGLRYEVGICIRTGWIVRCFGPFPCGAFSDLAISNMFLHPLLMEEELYVADGTYNTPYSLQPQDALDDQELIFMEYVRSRHETINRFFKQFSMMRNMFKRSPEKHGLFMHSIANIVQLGIQYGELDVFDVNDGSRLVDIPSSW